MKKILLIPRLKIQNANALSSPYTIGFPAMTAWLGAVHALQRFLSEDEVPDVQFSSAAVICHNLDLQTHKGEGDYVYSIIGTGNPLIPKGTKDDPNKAERPPFVEEARCHLEVSLLIEFEDIGPEPDEFLESVNLLIASKMKIAGGDIVDFLPAKLVVVKDDDDTRQLMRSVMPGFCLIERMDLMKQLMEEGKDALDALLEHMTVNHRSSIDDDDNVNWASCRKEKGWIVPIATGFHGISELGTVQHQRDPETLHRFAESVVTLGEFIMPYRLEKLDNMLWEYHYNHHENLYLCRQKQPIKEM